MSKKREPKCVFKDLAEAQKYLAEWQERLFLTDWIIKLWLTDEPIFSDGKRRLGECDYRQAERYALITLAMPDIETTSTIGKFCHERVLVHELLHCKFNFACEPTNAEMVFYCTAEHALLEQMAKSLIMAKYNVGLDFFKNF